MHGVEAGDRELVRRVAREAAIVVPLRTSVVIWLRFSAGCFGAFGLLPSATSFARPGSVTSGCMKLSTAAWTSLGDAQTCALRRRSPQVVDADPEQVARLQVVAEPDVGLDLGHARRARRAAARDLDVLLERADQLRDVEEREPACEAVLQRLEEELLPREPVEVGVGVPEADEVERLLAVELLVAGLQVDRRVAAGPAVRVDVAVVDVDVDAVRACSRSA